MPHIADGLIIKEIQLETTIKIGSNFPFPIIQCYLLVSWISFVVSVPSIKILRFDEATDVYRT